MRKSGFSSSRRVWITLGLVALLAVTLFVALPSASVATGTYCETTFYSDATYTTIVGERIVNCQGQLYTWGTTSTFKIKGCEPCGPL